MSNVAQLSELAMFGRSHALGQDSIHYQQLRGYELSRQLLDSRQALTGDKDRPLNIAVVGAGFSGITAALTFLKRSTDTKVTLFEHHRQILPRFFGAYGRMVHPYHHLRLPQDATVLDTDATGSRFTWHCPIHGGSRFETGGIDGILSWRPGPIEQVVQQVSGSANEELAQFVGEGRLIKRFGTRVLDLPPDPSDTGRIAVRWRDTKAIASRSMTTTADEQGEDKGTEYFDAVILALGGERDVQTIAGQTNQEYWNPMRIENSAPVSVCFEAAVIGSGNTAASEIFNLLLTSRDFVGILQQTQDWAANNHPFLTQALRGSPKSSADFEALLSPQEWESLAEAVASELVGNGKLYSDDMIRVTIFVRTSDPLFKSMNPLNRFLVLLLRQLGFVKIRNLYTDKDFKDLQPIARVTDDQKAAGAATSEMDYSISIARPGARRLYFRGAEVKAPGKRPWTYVFNCSGPQRFYQESFGIIGMPRPGQRHGAHYLHGGTAEGQMELTQMLRKKHEILGLTPAGAV